MRRTPRAKRRRWRRARPRRPLSFVEPFRLVAQEGAWSEIESLGEPSAYDRHCAHALSFPDERVRVFVHTSALVPVTARAVDVTFANGTYVKLRPGVAVGPALQGAPAGGERHVVDAGGARFLLDVPADAVSTSYVPSEKAGRVAETSVLLEDTSLRIADIDRRDGDRVATCRRDVGTCRRDVRTCRRHGWTSRRDVRPCLRDGRSMSAIRPDVSKRRTDVSTTRRDESKRRTDVSTRRSDESATRPAMSARWTIHVGDTAGRVEETHRRVDETAGRTAGTSSHVDGR